MRLVHVAPFYHPVIGGVEEVVKRIAEYMASKGNEVHILTYNRLRHGGVGSLPKEETISGVQVIRLKPNIVWEYGSYSNKLLEVLKGLKPDLVHVHVWRHPHVFQVAKVKEEMDFQAIIHTHAPFHKFSQLGLITWLYHRTMDWLKKGTLRTYDRLIALTPYERQMLTEKLDVKEDKVVIIPNGIEDTFIDQTQDKAYVNSVVLYLGRISKSKNVNLLVKAMKYVKAEAPDVKLVLAGPDEGLAPKLRDYALRYKVHLQYLGAVSENEKRRLYDECAIFAHPASYEPFGMTLLEAQAFGKPCIITGDGGQIYAAPPGKTGIYANPNPKEFGKAISRLLKDEELYKRLSKEARKWASQHSWTKILPRYQEAYGSICA